MISWAKALSVTPYRVLHGISYRNLMLYGKATPDYGAAARKGDKDSSGDDIPDDPSLRADDPANNPDIDSDTPTRVYD